MILSIDIGEASVRLGLITREGEIRARGEASVSFDGYKTPILTTVLHEAEAFLERERATLGGERPDGIGICATGMIDTRTGVVVGSNGRIAHWEGSALTREATARFGLPATALNDANAAALGECFVGRAKGLSDVIMVTLGSGLGGGIIIDGRVFAGPRGIAGELGHITLDRRGAPCTCGKRGCFELYASTSALVKLAGERTGEPGLTGHKIFARAKAGDEAMLRALHAWIDQVAEGLTGLVHIFNPQMVIIGGGVSAQEEMLIAPLRERVLTRVMPCFAEGLRLERATLGNDASLIGAAKFFMDRQAAM